MIEKLVSHFGVDYIFRFKNDIDIGVDAAPTSKETQIPIQKL